MFNNITLASVMGMDISFIIEFIGCLIFSFSGSILKEIYNTNSIRGYEFDPHKVISSTMVAALASSVCKIYVLENPTWETMAFVTFIFGLLGFEIFKNLSSINGIKRLIGDVRHIINLIESGEKKSTDNDDRFDIDNIHRQYTTTNLKPRPKVHNNNSNREK